jgi:hypothetical protein
MEKGEGEMPEKATGTEVDNLDKELRVFFCFIWLADIVTGYSHWGPLIHSQATDWNFSL